MTISRSKVLKTIGWTTVGVGLYLVGLGVRYDGTFHVNQEQPDDDIIDAEFTIIED